MPPSQDAAQPTIRSLVVAVYVPIVIVALGEGAVIPFIVLAAQERGASGAVAGAIYAVPGIASLVLAAPAGSLISRVGERLAAVVATSMAAVGAVAAVISDSVVLYGIWVFLMGSGWTIWRLVRYTYIVGAVARPRRGRALSVMGGSQRIGRFIGPLLAAALIAPLGLAGAFWLHVAASVLGLGVFLMARLPTGGDQQPGPGRLRGILRRHLFVFRTAGLGAFVLSVLRAVRPVALPLWGVHIGLDAAQVGVIFGLSSGVDAVLFYPAGAIMDRFGRKAAGIPSVVLLSTAFLLMPLTGGFAGLLMVGALMGVGNGLSAGYIATLGSDLAPLEGRAEFLGMWQTVSTSGQTAGPLVLGAILGIGSLAGAAVLVGIGGMAGALFIAMRVPETLVHDGGPSDSGRGP